MSVAILRALAREPLVHFVLLGGALFALDWSLRAKTAPVGVVARADLRSELSEGYARAEGRAPTPDELNAMVASWIDDEVLYREGIARGLDRDDPQVRQLIAVKMDFVLRSQVVLPTARESDLRAWFERHRDRYTQSELTDFTHVFVTGTDAAALSRASDILGLLRSGADPGGQGDRFTGGRRFRRRRIDDLAESFGGEFVAGLRSQPAGVWALHQSRYGLHLLRVDERTPALARDFAAARLDIERDWEQDYRARARAAALTALRRRWHAPVGEP